MGEAIRFARNLKKPSAQHSFKLQRTQHGVVESSPALNTSTQSYFSVPTSFLHLADCIEPGASIFTRQQR